MQDFGRASAAGSYPHADIDTSEIFSCPSGRIHKRQERDPYRARTYLGQRKNYSGMHFWARGYFVSTVGADEEVVKAYIQTQEKEDKRLEQLRLF